MSYILSGSNLRSPTTFNETSSTQVAQNRMLNGTIARDYFGDTKRSWKLSYRNVNATDYTIINNIYQSYLTNPQGVTWQVTEMNYTISQTIVHVDLIERDFSVKGSDYLSDFDLILTEA